METALTIKSTEILGTSFELSPIGLTVTGKPSEKEYDEAFQKLSLIEGAQCWWWGDLANAREKHYGSLKELAERLEINYNSLHNYQSIAKVYPTLDTRVSTLSFKHYQITAPLDDRLDWLKKAEENHWSTAELKKQIRLAKLLLPHFESTKPIITNSDYSHWLSQQPQCDLLLTDPPYSTELEDVQTFATDWLPQALVKVKPTGRAYIFIGAYPEELNAYLKLNSTHLILADVLVWCYQNTIGPSSSYDYNLNWQAILYYRGKDAPKLDCPVLVEQFTVQDINAPDGRTGIRYHEWEKPNELAERLIRHSTTPNQLVLDCFAGTGTFLLAAASLGRHAKGCDISKDMIDIAVKRGCILENGI